MGFQGVGLCQQPLPGLERSHLRCSRPREQTVSTHCSALKARICLLPDFYHLLHPFKQVPSKLFGDAHAIMHNTGRFAST